MMKLLKMDKFSPSHLEINVDADYIKYQSEFLFISGSHLYGTATPISDMDMRGYVLPEFRNLIGVDKFKCQEFSGEDTKIYSLKYYLELILSGDPLLMESLFIPDVFILRKDSIYDEILDLRDDLLSNNIYNRILGYSTSEWRKAMGLKYKIDERTKTEDEVVNDIRNLFKLEKTDMDSVLEILFKNKKRELVTSVPSVGARRREEYDKYGYCVKSASHSVRLVGELLELITTGFITFPRPDAKLLKKIKTGQCSKEEVNDIYQELIKKVEDVKSKSVLRDKPNRNKIWEVYSKIIAKRLMKDESFIKYSGDKYG